MMVEAGSESGLQPMEPQEKKLEVTTVPDKEKNIEPLKEECGLDDEELDTPRRKIGESETIGEELEVFLDILEEKTQRVSAYLATLALYTGRELEKTWFNAWVIFLLMFALLSVTISMTLGFAVALGHITYKLLIFIPALILG